MISSAVVEVFLLTTDSRYDFARARPTLPGAQLIGQTVTVLEHGKGDYADWVRIAGGWVFAGCLGIGERGCEAR